MRVTGDRIQERAVATRVPSIESSIIETWVGQDVACPNFGTQAVSVDVKVAIVAVLVDEVTVVLSLTLTTTVVVNVFVS